MCQMSPSDAATAAANRWVWTDHIDQFRREAGAAQVNVVVAAIGLVVTAPLMLFIAFGDQADLARAGFLPPDAQSALTVAGTSAVITAARRTSAGSRSTSTNSGRWSSALRSRAVGRRPRIHG